MDTFKPLSYFFIAFAAIHFSAGCEQGKGDTADAGSGNTEGVSPAAKYILEVGITSDDRPYIGLYGPARMSYQTQISTFQTSLTTMAGSEICTADGQLTLSQEQGDMFTCEIRVKRPMTLAILGMTQIESDHAFDNDGELELSPGEYTIRAQGTFEFVYDWEN